MNNEETGRKTCERGELISQIKGVADCLRGDISYSKRPVALTGLKKALKKVKDLNLDDIKGKYVSDWVPSYVDFDVSQHPLYPLPRAPKHVQLLNSDILGFCLCLKRNGLQDDCPKLGCQGTSKCVTHPIPTCHPSGLGEPPPKPVIISRPKAIPCAETILQNKLRRQKEKEERCKHFIALGRKNYTDDFCRDIYFEPCHRHDGTYVRKRLHDEKETQTNIEKYCKCKQDPIPEPGECIQGPIAQEEPQKPSIAPHDSMIENMFAEKMAECKEKLEKQVPFSEYQKRNVPVIKTSSSEASSATTSDLVYDQDIKRSVANGTPNALQDLQ